MFNSSRYNRIPPDLSASFNILCSNIINRLLRYVKTRIIRSDPNATSYDFSPLLRESTRIEECNFSPNQNGTAYMYTNQRNETSLIAARYPLLFDIELSMKRVINIFNLIIELKKIKNNNQKTIPEKIQEIKTIVNRAKDKNAQLSFPKKWHRSYRENRDTGQGILSSLWGRTLFQSQANLALVNVLEMLQLFTVHHQSAINSAECVRTVPEAPPAYSQTAI